jgi:hypothetical protein
MQEVKVKMNVEQSGGMGYYKQLVSEGGGTGRRAGLRNLSRKPTKPAPLNGFSNGVNPFQT